MEVLAKELSVLSILSLVAEFGSSLFVAKVLKSLKSLLTSNWSSISGGDGSSLLMSLDEFWLSLYAFYSFGLAINFLMKKTAAYEMMARRIKDTTIKMARV